MKRLTFILAVFVNCYTFAQVPSKAQDFIVDLRTDEHGKTLVGISAPGKPPLNFRMPVSRPVENSFILSEVPAYDWSFGCSATSGAMMAGYYDRHGYNNVYTGPVNGGQAPLDNSIWGHAVINNETRSLCPLSATRQDLDGRLNRGHVDDYWIHYGNNDPDPYITNEWNEHMHGDCTADFMKTNQSVFGNSDGSTIFYYYVDGSPTGLPIENDGLYGLKLFFESRGYNVVDYYNQYIYGFNDNTLGFTFQQFKQQIDIGRPVMIQVAGHSMVGTGYNDDGSIVYMHDTWDYSQHQMIWGGDYAGMQHYGVGVIELQPVDYDPCAAISNILACGSVNLETFTGGGTGVWFTAENNPCGCFSAGTEKIYSFQAPATGTFALQVTEANGEVSYSWKTGGCNDQGWNCIGVINTPGQYGVLDWSQGETYFILLDDNDHNSGVHSFFLICPPPEIPFYEPFDSPAWPDYWQQTYDGQIPSERWNVSSSNFAGGTPFEMIASWTEGLGVSRLILPPLNTEDFENLQLSFRQFYDDYGYGCTMKIQSGPDGINWYDEDWSHSSGNGNITPVITIVDIQHEFSPYIYIAFVIEGDHYAFDYWYIDEVHVDAMPKLPAVLSLENMMVASGGNECFNATENILVAGDGSYFILQDDTYAEFIAGISIIFREGTWLQAGSQAYAHITGSGEYCMPGASRTIVLNQEKFSDNQSEIQKKSTHLFEMYPNPCRTSFTIANRNSPGASEMFVEIYTMQGKRLLQSNINQTYTIFDVSLYARGIYVVKISGIGEMQVRKLVIN